MMGSDALPAFLACNQSSSLLTALPLHLLAQGGFEEAKEHAREQGRWLVRGLCVRVCLLVYVALGAGPGTCILSLSRSNNMPWWSTPCALHNE